jgi:uncharacterized protein (TIGR03437 family)
MNFLFLRLFLASVCAVAASAAVRHGAADGRATATLDEIAKRRDSRVPPIAPPRDIHEPESVPRTRRGGRAQSRAFPTPRVTTANAPVSYTGFLGLLDNFTAIPPDTTGAVGPQHVVTMLNTQVHIQSRSGAGRANYPISLNAFWSPLGASGDTFDPRIQYDAAADRWIACAGLNPESQTSALLVAVSQTSDPGAAWSYFKVNIGPNNWGDYPVLGFNGNWIVVSINQFRVRNNAYMGTTLYVFNKADLYRGGTGSNLSFTDPSGELIPVRDFDNRPDLMYFVQTFAGFQGVFRLLRLQGQPESESFGPAGTDLRVDDGWADFGSRDEGDVAPQLGSSAKIDAGDSRLQNCVMRGGTIWCAHTIFLPAGKPTRAAIQWFQLDPAGPAMLQRGRLDDDAGAVFYAYPSIAVNRNNDMLVGFTRFAETEHAAAAFAFRVASDPPGALEPEVVYKRGEAPYTAPGSRTSSNRWGDYSLAVVDPADDVTFWTLQEYATTPPENQRGQFGVWWAKVTAPSAGLRCAFSLSSSTLAAGPATSTGSVSVTTTTGCPWMSASNTPWLQVTAGSPATGSGAVTFAVAANGNPNAGRTGTITIAGQTFTVSQSAPPVGVDLTITSVTAPVTAEPGQAVTISATVANSSATAAVAFRVGLYLGVGPKIASRDTLLSTCTISALAPQTTANCTRTIPIPTAIQPGRYVIGAIADDQGTISDPNPANNSATSDSGPITITSPTVRPSLPGQGIVSAASFHGGAVAPGEIVTMFGTNLGPSSPQLPSIDAQGNVATIAGGTRVLFDGIPAAILCATAGQVSAVVPFSVRTATQVQVEYLGTRSEVVTLPVAAAAPAIFTANGSGKGPGAILNGDLVGNSPTNGASRGGTIVIYATGGGVIPGIVDGRLAQPPYTEMRPFPTVRIGGIAAQVTYAGVAPGLIAGMLQLNAIVPVDAPTGSAVPIEFSVGDIASPAGVTVAIR